jgi:hypothetical protein
VREEFRDRWAAFYASERTGTAPASLAAHKAQLLAEQKDVLDGRRNEACSELRESRDMCYRAILNDQREARATLRERQGAGLDNGPYLKELENRIRGDGDIRAGFREVAHQVTSIPGQSSIAKDRSEEAEPMGQEEDADNGSRIGHGLGGALVNFADALFFDLINLGSAPQPKPRRTDDMGRSLVDIAAEEATKQRELRVREDEDEQWRRKQKTLFRE